MSSNADNAEFHFLSAPPNVNPIWEDLVESNRKDFVATNTIVDTMASESMHGRGYVNGGDSIAANYLKNEFKKIGLKSRITLIFDLKKLLMGWLRSQSIALKFAMRFGQKQFKN